MKKGQNQAIDLTKFLLALLVMALHINPFGTDENRTTPIYPLARIAVPMFFLFSSYFFFRKCNDVRCGGSVKEEGKLLRKYIVRNLELYFAWFLVQFPVTIWLGKYYKLGLVAAAKKMIRLFFLGSTFPGSWFLTALVFGMPIVWGLYKIFRSDIPTIIVGFAVFIIGCMQTEYEWLFKGYHWYKVIIKAYPARLYHSFPIALLWIAIGKIIAQKELRRQETQQAESQNKLGVLVTGLVISFACLCLEHGLVLHYGWVEKSDCMLMLIPVCIFLFLVLQNVRVEGLRHVELLRMFSIITYCMHGAVGKITWSVCYRLGVDTAVPPYSLGRYLFTGAVCAAATYAVYHLEKKGWKWLHVFH